MKYFFIGLLALAGLAACTGNGQADDGCEYQTTDVLMTIKDIVDDPEREGFKKVVVSFNASSLALEDQELGELRDMEITEEYIERKHMHIGNKYRGTVSDLIKGNCQELFLTFEHNLD